jgi:hypothetical protein
LRERLGAIRGESMKSGFCSCIPALVALWGVCPANAQSACTGPNGSRFNLEPRPNAVVQAARSVAFLPGRAGPDLDLVVATATDERGLAGSPDGFYVQRSNANCAPDLEGGLPDISNASDLFVPDGTPTVIADPAREAFFIVDLRFGLTHDENGVGIVRATAANLLSSTACPSGTESGGSASCWTIGAVTNITELNAFLDSPHIAVDPRTSGTGAGDIYTVVAQRTANGSSTSISLTACTNAKLACGKSIAVSGADGEADFPFVQVRPDGGVTVSYRNTTFPNVNPEEIKFVTCTPNGAPAAPTCSAAVLVTTENDPVFATLLGDVPMEDQLYPRHAHRLESDGKTVTTFLVYDRCDVAVTQQNGLGSPFCPKSDVALTSSSDGGASWSPIAKVSASPGQQFFGAVATDVSTETVSIAYYSTENDFFQQRPQVFLAQVAAGSTAVGAPQLLTSDFGDVQASPPIVVLDQPTGFGDRLGLAAGGTGTAGESHAYVAFTWDSVFGNYGGVPSADVNNHLTAVSY